MLATRGNMGGSAVPLKSLPKHVPQAFIAIEDRRFYSHYGIDPIGIARAFTANVLRRGVAQGGSTLTQQLAKNLFLTQERTLTRKVQEVALALWLEHKFSKAADPRHVSQPRLLRRRRLWRRSRGRALFQQAGAEAHRRRGRDAGGPCALAVAACAKPQPAGRREARPARAGRDGGHEVHHRRRGQDRADRARRMPRSRRARARSATSPTGSWTCSTTWSAASSRTSWSKPRSIRRCRRRPRARWSRSLRRTARRPASARARWWRCRPTARCSRWSAGRNYAESQFNRAVAAKRQPGSAFKPFVYLTALERGLTPDTVREDKPIAIKGWRPENYTHEYFGAVTLSQALAMSLNTVSVRLTHGVRRRRPWCAPRIGSASPPSSSRTPRSRSAPRRCRCWSWSAPMRRSPTAAWR